MIDTQSIGGAVDNGRRGVAIFRPFYEGPVSITDRGDRMEVAFFAPPARYKLPLDGMLDGERVQVTGIRVRDLNPEAPVSTRSTEPRAVVATVIPLA